MKLVEEDNFQSVIPSSKRYVLNQITVSFIYLAGLDIYPIYPDLSPDEIRNILTKVNGVLLPGGMTNVVQPNPESNDESLFVYSRYAKAAKIILEEAKRINNRGNYFPVFGICLGFQSMIAAETNDMNIVEKKDVGLGYNATLEYTIDSVDSRLLSSIPRYLIDYMGRVKTTNNFHEYMVDYEKFMDDPLLKRMYKVLSLSKSKDETVSFISMIEGIDYPFYGFQFHPEFAIHAYYPKSIVSYPNKNIAAEIAREIMELIRTKVSKNTHKIEKDEDKLLANTQVTITLDSKFNLPFYLLG